MLQELKLQLPDRAQLVSRLEELHAQQTSKTKFTDTYFKQLPGKVLKTVEKDNGAFLNVFIASNGKFEVARDEALDDIDSTKAALTKQYGIKRIMTGERTFYQLDDKKITINSIDGVGDFLIVTSNQPDEDFVVQTLGIKDPVYVDVSFDEL